MSADAKHAYLIMAHNNFYVLEKLLRLLDDHRNDIYLHIDKKVSGFDFAYYKDLCTKANVIYPEKRIAVNWGTQSQVVTEMLLYETACSNGPYQYYHLLSGVDLPLKTQTEICRFFEGKHCEFLYFKTELNSYDIMRVSRYHFFVRHEDGAIRWANHILDRMQSRLHIDRTACNGYMVQRGSNWCDLTQRAVEILLQKKKEILKFTRFSLCADEVYKQTFLAGCGLEICNDDLRLVDWSRSPNGNNPHIFTLGDWDMMVGSTKLFARKFDEDIDKAVADKLYEYICNQQV